MESSAAFFRGSSFRLSGAGGPLEMSHCMPYFSDLKLLTTDKSPPMVSMSSGVPFYGVGVEDHAVCMPFNAVKRFVSHHQRGHTANPVPRLFWAHPLVSRIHLLRYPFVPRLRALHLWFATAVSRRRPTTRTACPRSLLI